MPPNFSDQITLFYAMALCAFSGGRIKPPEGLTQAKAFTAEAQKQLPQLFQPSKPVNPGNSRT